MLYHTIKNQGVRIFTALIWLKSLPIHHPILRSLRLKLICKPPNIKNIHNIKGENPNLYNAKNISKVQSHSPLNSESHSSFSIE